METFIVCYACVCVFWLTQLTVYLSRRGLTVENRYVIINHCSPFCESGYSVVRQALQRLKKWQEYFSHLNFGPLMWKSDFYLCLFGYIFLYWSCCSKPTKCNPHGARVFLAYDKKCWSPSKRCWPSKGKQNKKQPLKFHFIKLQFNFCFLNIQKQQENAQRSVK